MNLMLTESKTIPYTSILVTHPTRISEELRRELLRKSIHLLIGFVPVMAFLLGRGVTLGILGAGTVFYTVAESLRLSGRPVPLISRVTEQASRSRDAGKFVLGPITLGLGAMLALLIYPDPAASIAIYALAFGDAAASVIGKFAGMRRIPGTRGKTVEGGFGCFVAVLLVAIHYGIPPLVAVPVALLGAVTELLPLRDMDNLALPLITGLSVVAALG